MSQRNSQVNRQVASIHRVEVQPSSVFAGFLRKWIAAEISAFVRYYDLFIQWKPRLEDSLEIYHQVQCSQKKIITQELHHEGDLLPSDVQVAVQSSTQRAVIFLNGNLNHDFDIQKLLTYFRAQISRNTRIVAVLYNPYLSAIYRLANRLGLRKGPLPTTFITETDLKNIALLSGFECVRVRPTAYFPFSLFGLGSFLNWVLPSIPILKNFSFATLAVLRPIGIPSAQAAKPSLTVVIPARNERGNIEAALQRMPDLGTRLEILFVEGHSKDGTWAEIQRVIPLYSNRFSIRAFQQLGKGKSDAVRLGFHNATGDVLTILDADLTMPPELLGRFYDAYCSGFADFINGTRLVYPMEGDAMRFLNRLGNVFFAKALSFVLGVRIGDSLCGTKMVAKHDYQRMIAWRKDFGDFDPFGDFELLFPAADLALGIVDIPIRYLARTYGSTNISRFRHGLMLLRMTWIGLIRVKLGRSFKKEVAKK